MDGARKFPAVSHNLSVPLSIWGGVVAVIFLRIDGLGAAVHGRGHAGGIGGDRDGQ